MSADKSQEGDGPPMQTIELSGLAIPELHVLKQRISEALGALSSHLQAVRSALDRLRSARQATSNMTPDVEGAEILMPLTTSVFIPARLKDVNNVLVDVGTGYHILKDVQQTVKYFDKKIDMLSEQSSKLVNAIQEKQRLADGVQLVMQEKLLLQQENK